MNGTMRGSASQRAPPSTPAPSAMMSAAAPAPSSSAGDQLAPPNVAPLALDQLVQRHGSGPARHGVDEEVHPHAQRRFVQRDGIMIRLGIFPAVPEIARVRVVHRQPVAEEDAEAARRLAVVLVDLRQALREVVDDVIDRMRQRHVHQLAVGEDALHLAAEALVEPVVVVGVEEAAALQVLAQPRAPRRR